VHLAGVAPALASLIFQCDSEYARNPQDAHSWKAEVKKRKRPKINIKNE